jgi:branched-chain amino acid transport system ATP-binding protein
MAALARRHARAAGGRAGEAVVTALQVQGLAKSFGGLKVTQDVSLAVAAGERRLIIGPNGAGKTTLFNQIAGDLRPDAGSIRLFGTEMTGRPARERAHLGLARTFQIITLFHDDSLLHNVTLALLGLSRRRWNGWSGLAHQSDLRDAAFEALRRVGLAHLADRRLSDTSYGERRRVEIAMALAQQPRVLLLDEPFAGLSIDERKDVLALLQSIPGDITIVMIEHDMDVALAFAQRVTLMHYGQVLVEGTREDVVAHPKTREVYLGH